MEDFLEKYSHACFDFGAEIGEMDYIIMLVAYVRDFARYHNIDPIEALESAVDEIWDRKGSFKYGKFVKEEP